MSKEEKRIKKTLGRFKLHYMWHNERYRGMRGGYLASYMARALDWSIQFDIGGRESNVNKTQRQFILTFIKFHRGAILKDLLEPEIKWSTQENLRRQLIALRMFRARYYEMIEKGDKDYAEKQAGNVSDE